MQENMLQNVFLRTDGENMAQKSTAPSLLGYCPPNDVLSDIPRQD